MEKLKQIVAALFLRICFLFPIKNNKIFFMSYYGANYSCNPKYIMQYIIKTYPINMFDLVWAFNNPKKGQEVNLFRMVKTMSLRYFYELATAKVIITNYRMPYYFTKRNRQYYVQTWHSSLRLKQIERDAAISLPSSYIEMAKKDSKQCDLLLSGCLLSTNIFRQSFWYDGEIFEYGTPRNDFLLEKDHTIKPRIIKKLGLDPNKKIVLYAPTFRSRGSQPIEHFDEQKIKRVLEQRFSSSWQMLVKLHPHFTHVATDVVKEKEVIDVTLYDDIQELLFIADIVITDYSSLMFDFLLTKRPCFLYVPDLHDYRKNERKLYFKLEELPFQHTATNEELVTCIRDFNEVVYKKKSNFS